MQRNVFIMRLKPGCEAEYKKRHDEVWPELSELLRQAGISDYSIFLDRASGTLFATQNLADDHTAADLPAHPLVRKWWDHMADIMETHPDNSPVCIPLEEMFHMK